MIDVPVAYSVDLATQCTCDWAQTLGVILSYLARRNTQDPAFGKEGKNADRMAFSTRSPVSAREVGIHKWATSSVSAS